MAVHPGASNSLKLPERFAHFQILERLGKGGMGTVYLALDQRLDRRVALKVCHIADKPDALERFKREAQAAASLRHANLCPVHDFDVCDGVPYFTMSFIEGPTLDKWVDERGGLSERNAALLVGKLALALQYAHERGVVHRDLKPANIAMDGREPIVLDFGLARLQENADRKLTKTGAILGTPSYMSPEQVEGDPHIGPATDLYSLGVILYELLAGRLPFQGAITAVLAYILIQEPPPPRSFRPDLDPALEAICLKALRKKPAERWPNMKDFAAALTNWVKATPPAANQGPRLASGGRAGTTEEFPVQAEPAQTLPTHSGAPPLPLGPVSPGKAQATQPRESDAGDFAKTIGMRFVRVPKGTFWMGGGGGKAGDKEVEIKEDFELGATEVTQGQWQAVMGNNPSWFSRQGGGRDAVKDIPDAELKEFPVENVSFYDVQEFLMKLNEKRLGRGGMYRLPTEAQWEYACRGGATSREDCSYDFYLERPSNDLSSLQANFNGNFPGGKAAKGPYLARPCKVGSYKPNRLGLYDMHGNVWEWCEERRIELRRVLRGGAFGSYAMNARSSDRCFGDVPANRYSYSGFRPARTFH